MTLVLDGFEPGEKMEDTAIASVWTARQQAPARRVLVKHIFPALLPTPAAREAFRQRAQDLGRLLHPGLVRQYEVLVREEDIFLITARREGLPLDQRIQRDGPVSERKALDIAEGLARILQHAWDREWWIDGWLHPARIAEDINGHVFIQDFAVTRLLLESTSIDEDARQKAIGAAEFYLAPEQLLIKPSKEVVSDIYAVGAILYHAVSGAQPFGDVHGDYLRDKHLYEQLDDPRIHQPSLSTGFALLLEKMLIRDRLARPAAWKTILSDIDTVRGGGKPAGPRPTPGQSVLRCADAQHTPPPRPAPSAPKVVAVFPQAANVAAGKPAPDAPAAAGSPPGEPPAGTPTESAAGPAVPRPPRQIVLTKEDVERLQQRKKRRNEVSVLVLLVIALAITATYGLIQRNPKAAAVWQNVVQWTKARWQELATTVERGGNIPAELPTMEERIITGVREIPKPQQEPGTPGAAPTVRPGVPTGAPGTAGTGPSTGPAPQTQVAVRPARPTPPPNPLFLEGAQHFNAALELFEQFRQTRNASLLTQVEQRALAAQDCFERYRQAVPQDGRATKYIDQCFGMVRYARQAALQSGGASHPPTVSPPPQDPPKPARSSALDRIREMEAQKERAKQRP